MCSVELPVVSSGLDIGIIHLNTKSVEVINNIFYDCANTVECCSELRIPVTDHDIKRIQDQGYELFQIIDSASPIILPSKTMEGNTEKVYLIKRKPFVYTCTFLEDNLCSIHHFKPFTCRIYPFALEILDDETIKVVIHTEKLCSAIQYKEECNVEHILYTILDFVLNEMQDRGMINTHNEP
ncbi:MAG: YkgJ family cysteine cluster protein [Candidatus Heimdallarchaeota archaeon]|nr:YkgJ family cysteine cluster protein [Candidatus Heimdallarchaeota archaeon]